MGRPRNLRMSAVLLDLRGVGSLHAMSVKSDGPCLALWLLYPVCTKRLYVSKLCGVGQGQKFSRRRRRQM